MKSLVIDSSSAILLFKSGLFDIIIKNYHVFMTDAVYSELIVSGHSGWDKFISINRRKLIRVINDDMHNGILGDDELLKMGIGERSTISLYFVVRADFILIDDGRGTKYCKKNEIPFLNALLMVKILYFLNYINEIKYRAAFQLLKKIGRYSVSVINYAETCSEEDASFFLIK